MTAAEYQAAVLLHQQQVRDLKLQAPVRPAITLGAFHAEVTDTGLLHVTRGDILSADHADDLRKFIRDTFPRA